MLLRAYSMLRYPLLFLPLQPDVLPRPTCLNSILLQFDESIRSGHSGKPACSDMMGGLSYWDWIGLPENEWRCAVAAILLAAAAGWCCPRDAALGAGGS